LDCGGVLAQPIEHRERGFQILDSALQPSKIVIAVLRFSLQASLGTTSDSIDARSRLRSWYRR
jgi:hypothetical protein